MEERASGAGTTRKRPKASCGVWSGNGANSKERPIIYTIPLKAGQGIATESDASMSLYSRGKPNTKCRYFDVPVSPSEIDTGVASP